MQRLARRDRGSALVIAVILIVVTAAMIGMLLAAPQAQLSQVGGAIAKERSLANADVGVRDAVNWIMANKTNLANWVVKNQSFLVSTNNGIAGVPSGTGWALSAPTSTPSPNPASTYTNNGCGNLVLKDDRGSGTSSVVLTKFLQNPNSFPIFAAGNYKPFGDRHTSQNEYAYCIFDEGNGYYRVLSEGRALASNNVAQNSSGQITGSQTIASRIEAYIYNPIQVSSNPAAVTFVNPNNGSILNKDNSNQPSGWTNPDTSAYKNLTVTAPVVYTSTKGGSGDKIGNTPTGMINGTDQSGLNSPTTGVGIQGNNLMFPNTVTDPKGATSTPATTAAGQNAVDTNLGSNVTNSITSIVNAAAAAGSSNGITSYTYGGTAVTVGSATPTITYVKIPDNTTVDSGIFTFNGNTAYAGILIVDVGNNVTFNFNNGGTGKNALFTFNGNPNQELGAFIFYQRGTIKIPQSGVYLADNQGNATDKLQWNSYDYQTALSALTNIPLKITSYRVVQ